MFFFSVILHEKNLHINIGFLLKRIYIIFLECLIRRLPSYKCILDTYYSNNEIVLTILNSILRFILI